MTGTGVIVTNAHVARGEESLLAMLSTCEQVEAKVVYIDQELDIALVKVDVPSTKTDFLHLPLIRISRPRGLATHARSFEIQQSHAAGYARSCSLSSTRFFQVSRGLPPQKKSRVSLRRPANKLKKNLGIIKTAAGLAYSGCCGCGGCGVWGCWSGCWFGRFGSAGVVAETGVSAGVAAVLEASSDSLYFGALIYP